MALKCCQTEGGVRQCMTMVFWEYNTKSFNSYMSHWTKLSLVSPCHWVNKCKVKVIWTTRNTFQWPFNRNFKQIFTQENVLQHLIIASTRTGDCRYFSLKSQHGYMDDKKQQPALNFVFHETFVKTYKYMLHYPKDTITTYTCLCNSNGRDVNVG